MARLKWTWLSMADNCLVGLPWQKYAAQPQSRFGDPADFANAIVERRARTIVLPAFPLRAAGRRGGPMFDRPLARPGDLVILLARSGTDKRTRNQPGPAWSCAYIAAVVTPWRRSRSRGAAEHTRGGKLRLRHVLGRRARGGRRARRGRRGSCRGRGRAPGTRNGLP